jgi:hypothetical protein
MAGAKGGAPPSISRAGAWPVKAIWLASSRLSEVVALEHVRLRAEQRSDSADLIRCATLRFVASVSGATATTDRRSRFVIHAGCRDFGDPVPDSPVLRALLFAYGGFGWARKC